MTRPATLCCSVQWTEGETKLPRSKLLSRCEGPTPPISLYWSKNKSTTSFSQGKIIFSEKITSSLVWLVLYKLIKTTGFSESGSLHVLLTYSDLNSECSFIQENYTCSFLCKHTQLCCNNCGNVD